MEQEEQEGSDLRFSKMSSLQSSGRDTNNHLMGLLLFVQVGIILEKGLEI